MGVAISPAGNVFVTSSTTIRMIAPDGRVTTVGGATGAGDFRDGLGTSARFGSGASIASDHLGGLYLSDTVNALIRRGILVGRRGTQLTNLSVRSAAGIDADTLIVGFSLTGGTKPLLIRAVGPTLAALGVSGTLAAPTLRLRGSGARIAENDDWQSVEARAPPAPQPTLARSHSPRRARTPLFCGRWPPARIRPSRGGSGVALEGIRCRCRHDWRQARHVRAHARALAPIP